MGWTEQLIHFVDFEGSLSSGILEYGVVSLREGSVAGVHTRLCGAKGRIREEDIAVHGITGERVAACAPIAADWELFAGLRETGPFAAHFANAENTLIKSVWSHARTSPDFSREDGSKSIEWGPWIDTGRLYPALFDGLPSAKLEDLVVAMRLQVELDALASVHCPADRRFYHAALYDALAGALLLLRLMRQPEMGAMSLNWLIAHSTLDGGRRDAIRQQELF